jgi:hypothetical protein
MQSLGHDAMRHIPGPVYQTDTLPGQLAHAMRGPLTLHAIGVPRNGGTNVATLGAYAYSVPWRGLCKYHTIHRLAQTMHVLAIVTPIVVGMKFASCNLLTMFGLASHLH